MAELYGLQNGVILTTYQVKAHPCPALRMRNLVIPNHLPMLTRWKGSIPICITKKLGRHICTFWSSSWCNLFWKNSGCFWSNGITRWWFQPIWKILVKLDQSPGRGKNKKYLKPTPRIIFHQPQIATLWFRGWTPGVPNSSENLSHGPKKKNGLTFHWILVG